MRRALLLLACLLVAPMALGQGAAGSVELTPTVGYWFGDSLGRGSNGELDYDVEIDDAPAYGLRLTYNFSDSWGLEFLLARERADLVTGNDGVFSGKDKVGSIDMTTGEVSFAAGFGHRRLVPFLAGGIGAMNLDPRLGSSSSDTRFSANFGGGFKLYFAPEIALRFDWRGHAVENGKKDDCDWWDDCHDRHQWLRFSEVSLGLAFAF